MFFGMCNSPSMFQQMMNDIFLDKMHEGFMVIYMDDLLIFMHDMSHGDHAKLVKCILKKLRENNLFIKPSKCTFFAESVNFLRMMVSKNGVSMDPAKVSTIKEYQAPYDVKGVRHF